MNKNLTSTTICLTEPDCNGLDPRILSIDSSRSRKNSIICLEEEEDLIYEHTDSWTLFPQAHDLFINKILLAFKGLVREKNSKTRNRQQQTLWDKREDQC